MGNYLRTGTKDTIALETAQLRRQRVCQLKRDIPSDIECDIINEYIETPFGHILYVRRYIPKNNDKIKGIVFHAMGYGSFMDWTDYNNCMEFVRRNYMVIQHEHYGHGRSDGLWLCNPDNEYSFDTYVNDAIYVFERSKRLYTPKRFIKNGVNTCSYFMLGHSLGGAISIAVSIKYAEIIDKIETLKNNGNFKKTELIEWNERNIKMFKYNEYCNMDMNDVSFYGWNGMVLSAPMCTINPKLVPNKYFLYLGNNVLVYLIPNARIIPTKNMANHLTRDKEMFKFIKSNPIGYNDKTTLKTGLILLKLCAHIQNNMDKIKIPFLVCHGEMDKITDPNGSKYLYNNAVSNDKTIKIFNKCYHGLMFDLDKSIFFNGADNWMNDRLTK